MKKMRFLLFLIMCIPLLGGCSSGDGKIHINFEPIIELKTNTIKEQVYDAPHKVKKPTIVIIDDNPNSLELYGWYTSKDFTTQWNFSKDIASQSMTLYGKFESQFEVNYYQGVNESNMGLLATELVFKNELVPTREDLPDCYENPETCYLSDVSQDESGVIKGTKGTKVNFGIDIVDEPKNILIRRSENIYFTPDAILRRFSPVASSEGMYGSTVGSISVETEETTNEKYAHIDFGEVSKNDPAVDPYIIFDNPQIDVTKSQYLEITMRNPGFGDTLAFYWVGKWKINGKWINGKEYHSFAEDRTFKFKAGNGTNTDSVIYTDYSENHLHYLNQSNEWRTYLIPISNKMSNGVSVWGNAGVITALRIQSSFPNSNPDNQRTNVLDIKSIKGVKSEKEYSFDDSPQALLKQYSDSDVDLVNASSSQPDINGLIFPKNRSIVKPLDEKTEVYNHIDGLLMHGTYVNEKATIEMSLPTEKEIDLNRYTTFNFKYRNYSYADKITFVFRVRYTEGAAKGREVNVTQSFSCPTNMGSIQEAKINMFGVGSFEGNLIKLTVSFNTIGVDNMIEFQEFRFSDYEPRPIVGINFYDLNCGGFSADSGINIKYDNSKHATMFDVTDSTKQAKNLNLSLDLMSFESFTLNYIKVDDSSISQIKIQMKMKDETSLVTYDIDISNKSGDNEAEEKITNHGEIEAMYISFNGLGKIYFKSIKLNYYDTTLNFTTGEYLLIKNCLTSDTGNKYVFDENELALSTNKNSAQIYGRLGARVKTDNMRINGQLMYNMSLAGKSKIVVTYQNHSNKTKMEFGFGALLKTDYLEDEKYKTQEALMNNPVTINGVTKKGGTQTCDGLKTNMSFGEWASFVLPIDEFFTRSTMVNPSDSSKTIDIECFLSTFYFATNYDMSGNSFLIRNFTLI